MAYDPLLRIVLGRDCAVDVETSSFENTALIDDPACFPCLVAKDGGKVDGILFTPENEIEIERLTYFAACLGVYPLQTQDGKVTTFWRDKYQPHQEASNSPHGWSVTWGAIALEVTQEIMAYHERRSANAVNAGLQMILSRAHARVEASKGVPANLRSLMQYDQIEVVQQDSPHAGFFVTRDFQLRHPTFSGGQSPVVRREVFVATDAAIVLPYDPVKDRVLLVEQFRMGPYGRGDIRPWMLEPVAGRVDPGETPEATASRECEEEAGLKLIALEKISSHYCSPGCSTEYFHLFLGVCDLPDLNTGQGGLETEHEDIRTHVLPFEAAMDLLTTGEADNGPLVLSLLWLARERERLRSAA